MVPSSQKFDFVRFGLIFVGISFLVAAAYFLVAGSVASELRDPTNMVICGWSLPMTASAWPILDSILTPLIGPAPTAKDALDRNMVAASLLPCLAVAWLLERRLSRQLA